MLKLDRSRQARKFLRRLPPKHERQVALKIVELLRDPRPHDSRPLKPPHSAYRRADVGEYRIIYRVEGDTLYLHVAGKRNDAEVYAGQGLERLSGPRPG